MRSFLSVASLVGIASGSVVVVPGGSGVVSDEPTVTCPLHPTSAMDVFYSQFLVSDTYVDSARSELLPANCLEKLFFHFGSSYENYEENASVIEDALVGRNCAMTTADLVGIFSNQRYHFQPRFVIDDEKRIRLDDYIASRDVYDRLENILALNPKPHPPSPDINLQLYYLHTDLTQRSACPNLESRLFRKLIEQIHFQLTIAVVENIPVPALTTPVFKFLHSNAQEMEESADRLSHPPRPMFMMAPLAAVIIPIVAEVGCWCIARCIKYYRDRTSTTTTTTTTTTTPSTIAAWIIEGHRRQIEQFVAVANSDLDEIMIKIGTVSGTDYEREIGALRSTFVMKIMAITKGMVSNGGASFDPTATLESSFRITELLSKSHEVAEWQSVRTEILTMVSRLRSELFSIRTSLA